MHQLLFTVNVVDLHSGPGNPSVWLVCRQLFIGAFSDPDGGEQHYTTDRESPLLTTID